MIHIHGFHHSGTGVLRQAVMNALGTRASELISAPGMRAPENEGQHLQSVYPTYAQRSTKVKCSDAEFRLDRFTKYYCPKLAELIDDKRSDLLFEQWSQYWDIEATFLVQKTPTFDLVLLEGLSKYQPVHLTVMSHPFAWRSAVFNFAPIELLHTWLKTWGHVLEILHSSSIKHYAVVKFENILLDTEGIVEQINNFLSNVANSTLESTQFHRHSRRGLNEFHGHQISKSRKDSKLTTNMNKCLANVFCHEAFLNASSCVSLFGYNNSGFYPQNSQDGFTIGSKHKVPVLLHKALKCLKV